MFSEIHRLRPKKIQKNINLICMNSKKFFNRFLMNRQIRLDLQTNSEWNFYLTSCSMPFSVENGFNFKVGKSPWTATVSTSSAGATGPTTAAGATRNKRFVFTFDMRTCIEQNSGY